MSAGRSVLLFAALALLAQPGIAQDGNPAIEETDPSGDTIIVSPAGQLGVTDQFPAFDILAVRLAQTSGGILFAVQTGNSQAVYDQPDVDAYGEVAWVFNYGSAQYVLDFYGAIPGMACLYKEIAGTTTYDDAGCFEIALNGVWLEVELAPDTIRDGNGVILRHPAQLQDLHARSTRQTVIFGPQVGNLNVTDRAPDTGFWNDLITLPEPGSSGVIITAVQSIRASNGGADVLLFEVLHENARQETVALTFSLTDLPGQWQSRVPGSAVLARGENALVSVLVTITGSHRHGDFVQFNLTTTLQDGTAVQTPLGVKFLDIPQPAGHHPTVYMHSRNIDDGATSPQATWMNTLEIDERATQVPAAPWSTERDGSAARHIWAFPLPLQIGLDFNMANPVTGTLALSDELPNGFDNGRVALMVCDPDDGSGSFVAEFYCSGSWFPLAEQGLPATTLTRGQATTVELSMPLLPRADLVAPEYGANLALVVETSADPALRSVRVLPTETRLHLPLFEYRDDPVVDPQGQLALEAVSPIRIAANPGKPAWIELKARNLGPSEIAGEITVIGHNAEWFTVDPKVNMPSNGERSVFVQVIVPEGSARSEFATVAVILENTRDPASSALQFLEVITTMEPVDSWPGPQESSKSTPALAVPALLVLLACLAALVARH